MTDRPMPNVLGHSLNDRQIRVFISSTFRDMHAERDHLVKVVFPQLRRLCESRGITWGEVDLRWGVTDESAAEGKVLPVCLEEINRCRPYFIGLLGERYGWVPQSVPQDVLEKEAWIGECLADKKSVTELEILHGVLRNTEMAGHAFFYFRAPAYIKRLPPDAVPEDFASENADSATKLNRLKQLIRDSGIPVHESYPDPTALGDLVLADLTAVINQRWPEGLQPTPLDREALDHAAYAQSRERVYIGRPEYFARLDAHADGEGDLPLAVLGESGSGKSALLANWAAHYRWAHPETFLLEHYIGSTRASADWAALLRRIMGEFKRKLGVQQDIPAAPDALRAAFPNWLHMAAARGRVVLVLDALNELEDREGTQELLWLPLVMPENVRLIVSALPGKPLNEIKTRGWPTLTVDPLSPAERKELIRIFLCNYGRELSPVRISRIVEATQTANPLYLCVLLDELRLFGLHERLDEHICYYLQAPSPYELYGKVITRWVQDYGGGTKWVLDALTLLWVARRGLSETELLDALGQDGKPLPRAVWSPLFLAMREALVSHNGLLTFAHDFLRTAVRDACLMADSSRQLAHERLADYFQRQPSNSRRTDELPWQLAEAHAWQRLHDLLTDHRFFTDVWSRNRFDVKAYWALIESCSPLRVTSAYCTEVDQLESEDSNNHLWNVSILLEDMGHPEEALRLRVVLSERFRASGNMIRLQSTLLSQASILSERGDLDRALALLVEVDRICNRLADLSGLQRSRCEQARIMIKCGKLDGAIEYLDEAARFFQQLGDEAVLSVILANKAGIFCLRGNLDEAILLYNESERICRQLGNLDGLQVDLGNMANILCAREELDGALSLLKEKERICRQLGNQEGLQATLGNQANILYVRGDLDGAMALNKGKERICRQLGSLESLSNSLGNQALILQDRGDTDGAMTLHKENERICRQLGNQDGLQATLGSQAFILNARGDLDGAMSLLEEQERICRKLKNRNGLWLSLYNQAGILFSSREKDFRTSCQKCEEAVRILEESGLHPSYLKRANRMLEEILKKC